VMGRMALVTEAAMRGRHLRQAHARAALQKVLGPLDAAGDDVLVRRQTGGPSEPATVSCTGIVWLPAAAFARPRCGKHTTSHADRHAGATRRWSMGLPRL
jgi:hypothetical protein